MDNHQELFDVSMIQVALDLLLQVLKIHLMEVIFSLAILLLLMVVLLEALNLILILGI